MCGLFGVTGLEQKGLEKAHTALHTLTHRGPDGWGHMHQNDVYMGHRRLSILDLSENGKQPMEKDGVYLTVNGEIYNYKYLNNFLIEKHGVEFESLSDSETLLHGYIHWGIEKLLDRIEGMFAFVIYDSNTDKIYMARDHAGIKPLYYGCVNGQLSWASELKALQNFYGESSLKTDYTALYDFLTYGLIPAPKSLYEDIFKLEPAHYAEYDLKTGALQKKRYWSLPVNRHIKNLETAKKELRYAIKDEVRKHLVADVPVGTFLSGGVDSSIVSYEVSKQIKGLNTCSIGFDDPNVDETPFANMVAEKIGSHHASRMADHNFVNEQFGLFKTLFDEPFSDTSAFPTYLVSKLAREKMTVVLTGDGADELFGGYNTYKEWYLKLTPWLGFLAPLRPVVTWVKNKTHNNSTWHKIARKLEIFTIINPLERQIRLRGCLLKTDKFKKEFATKYNIPKNYDELWYVRPFYNKGLPYASKAQYLDFHTFMVDDILTKVDRASMANSIETRIPFLSKSIIELAWEVDENLLYLNGELKGLLKNMYEGILPTECLYRRKQGFSLGQSAEGDALHTQGLPLPEHILKTLFKEHLK